MHEYSECCFSFSSMLTVRNVRLHMDHTNACLFVPVKMISTFHAGSKMIFLLFLFFFLHSKFKKKMCVFVYNTHMYLKFKKKTTSKVFISTFFLFIDELFYSFGRRRRFFKGKVHLNWKRKRFNGIYVCVCMCTLHTIENKRAYGLSDSVVYIVPATLSCSSNTKSHVYRW